VEEHKLLINIEDLPPKYAVVHQLFFPTHSSYPPNSYLNSEPVIETMKSFIVTSLLALFCIVVLAAPEANPTKQDGGNKGHSYLSDGGHKRHGCLSDRAVHKIVQRYVSLGEGSIDLLDQVVTEDVIFEDEQVNFTMELPPGPYAVGKEAVRRILEFVHSQSGFKTIKIEPLLIVHDCDTISFRWQSTLEATGLNPNS
jgi:hypothetical protein